MAPGPPRNDPPSAGRKLNIGHPVPEYGRLAMSLPPSRRCPIPFAFYAPFWGRKLRSPIRFFKIGHALAGIAARYRPSCLSWKSGWRPPSEASPGMKFACVIPAQWHCAMSSNGDMAVAEHAIFAFFGPKRG
jgi:hypothetical protein